MDTTRTLLRRTLLTLFALALGSAASAEDIYIETDTLVGWPRDPVYVYYPRASCRGDEIDLQIFSRREKKWVTHPAHQRIPIESCQLEDAGVLWNELRWRCVEKRVEGEMPPSWVKGLDVFDPEVMEHCAVSRNGDGFGEMRIRVASPNSDIPVRGDEPVVTVSGNVDLGGLRGADYDVVIAIDISGGAGSAKRIRSQVTAARHFIERVRPRMDSTRVAIVTSPNVRPRRGEHTGAHTEIRLTDDSRAADAALAAIERRGGAGTPNFASGLAFALDQLQHIQLDGSGARSNARKVLLITADGKDSMPFGADADQAASTRAQVLSLAHRARDSGVAIHLYALGGIAAKSSALVEEMLRGNRGGFVQVKRPREMQTYLSDIRMPYVSYISITNETTGLVADTLRYSSGGAFSAILPAAFGWNHLLIEARSSDDEREQHTHTFEFDGSLVKERLLEAERGRVDRLRRRREVTVDLPYVGHHEGTEASDAPAEN